MDTAPTDGTEIWIKVRGFGIVKAYYVDCRWLREDDPDLKLDGTDIADCWRSPEREDDIELDEALGWCPITH